MWYYEIHWVDITQALLAFRTAMPDGSFGLSVILCLPLLGVFNYWLRKKFRHLLR